MALTALITGASSGIGKELARIHASKGGDVVLVARRETELRALKREIEHDYKVQAQIFPCDLSQANAAQEVYTFCQSNGIQVDYLMNNAGFGGQGNFVDRPLEKDLEMIHLNVETLVALTHLFLQDMKKRGSGKILNTASTAGFLPGPLQATYFATKAFVVSFSQSIAHELKTYNISVTALCPGPVKTEFEKVAGFEGGGMFDKAATAHQTALKGYNAMLKGKSVIISDRQIGFLIRFVLPFLPTRLLASTVQKLQTMPDKK